MEVKSGTIIVKDMEAGKQQEIKFKDAIPTILKFIGEKNLDTYTLRDKFVEVDED
jgi:hypothetical protein